jgi:tetratricopeptide (TPR) repeat protein
VRVSRVFVSHASDLAGFPAGRSFVQGVLDAVARAGMVQVDMRYFAASEGQPADYCQQRVRECDIYMAVVGFRYGSLVPGEAISYTELEFVEAGLAGLPRLVFLLEDTAEVPGDLVDVDRTRVDQFRQRLRQAGIICASFTTVDALELAVFHALKDWAGADARAVPRQLPVAVQHFAGRTRELAVLKRLLRGRAETGGTVVISAIGGTAGIGKTVLAVYWAHQVADRFPDGQLYVNLRGFDPTGQVMEPAEAVRRFLDALGVAPQRLPADLDAQAALYRSKMAGRRMLVVLDNARDTSQVRPLLPGAPTCLVLVTSRNRLTGLVAADGAHPILLDLLAPAEARELLTRRLGTDRTTADPQAVEEIITRCARLPLALTIAAAHAATHPDLPLHTLAAELRDASGRLDALTTDDPATDVRAVFSWSYQNLTPGGARLFRLLGLHPGPDISTAAAASLAALPPLQTRRQLAELTRVSLLTEHTPGRYALHDLLRAYSADLAHTHDSAGQRRAAVGRMFDHYVHTADAAARLLDPARDLISLALTSSALGVTPEEMSDQGQALAWLTAEHPVLLAAVRQAAEVGSDIHTWHLAWTLSTFLDWQGHWRDLTTTWQTALPAAGRLDDPTAQALAYRYLAAADIRLGRYPDAHTHLGHALDLFAQAGDQAGQAFAHYGFSMLWERQGRPDQALGHVQQALTLCRAAGHRSGEAYSLNGLGWYHALLGDHRQALTYCQQALTLLQELGERWEEANTWGSLGYAHHHLGHHTQAADCYQHALHLVRDLGDRYREAEILTHLGDTQHAAGDPTAAHTAWRHALGLLADLDHPDAEQVRSKLATLDTRPGGDPG